MGFCEVTGDMPVFLCGVRDPGKAGIRDQGLGIRDPVSTP